MPLFTTDRPSDRPIREGELIHVAVVNASNILRDMREMITNTFGGKMKRYEVLMDFTLNQALEKLEIQARSKGYDGCVGVRITHPRIADGACEIFVYGTGFNYVAADQEQ
jgi:uncharacterized protein YbjQ (UPF0145 family)